LGRNCLLQRVIAGKVKGWIDVTRRRGRRCGKLMDYLKERRKEEIGSARSHYVDSWLRKEFWACRKTDY
jgi:hypothetical protein